ncbi:hypothetical protein DPMN_162842 [Dreissena polymorpha]|uniref:Uncharacterized protein n=1 Tax=Dreissena polymorpha TaxID=45954 RepID=A0A9D4ES32_DREPO|nr:hypothetical protein DPMN_162842 [Dreissena polymorpha]
MRALNSYDTQKLWQNAPPKTYIRVSRTGWMKSGFLSSGLKKFSGRSCGLMDKASDFESEDCRSCGLMDKASDFESEDCRFESCQDRSSPAGIDISICHLFDVNNDNYICKRNTKANEKHSGKQSCGLMDKASDFESEDCRFESCQDPVERYRAIMALLFKYSKNETVFMLA